MNKCPTCQEVDNIACFDCGLFARECKCGSTHRFCYPCQEDFIVQLPGVDWDEIPKADTKPVVTKTHKKCDRHWFEPVDLGHGTIIHCSSKNNDRQGGRQMVPVPDFGLYADYGWKPTWKAILIDWPDFKLPRHLETGCELIHLAWRKASEEKVSVEIGCIGGHGRTGTILACMKVAEEKGEIDSDAAVDWVKEVYCSHAVETAAQKWFVSFFSNYWFGTELKEKPSDGKVASKSSTKSSTVSGSGSSKITPVGKQCTVYEHYAMLIRGHCKCYQQKDCKWWHVDAQAFPREKISDSPIVKRAYEIIEKYPLRYGGERVEADKDDTHILEMHAVMYEKGWRECAILGGDCGYWEEDLVKFERGDFSKLDRNEALRWLNEFENIPKVNA